MATTQQKLPTNSVGEDTILPLQIKITAKTREANSLPYKFVLSNCSTNQNLKRKRNGYNLTKKPAQTRRDRRPRLSSININ